MGGHGGLNILPQKSWNVYNIKNQNIVRRDEERFRQEQAEAQRKAQREEAEARLAKLRGDGHPETIPRFNLFEEEEKNASEFNKKRRQAEIEKQEKDKDTWYLGKARPINPWYERAAKLENSGPEIQRKSEMDPMTMVNNLLAKPQSSSSYRIQPSGNSLRQEKLSKKRRKQYKVEDSSLGDCSEKKDRKHRSKKENRHRSSSPSPAERSLKKRHV